MRSAIFDSAMRPVVIVLHPSQCIFRSATVGEIAAHDFRRAVVVTLCHQFPVVGDANEVVDRAQACRGFRVCPDASGCKP